MEAVLLAVCASLAAIGGTVGTRIVDRWFARKGVGPLQAELMDTLEATAKARADRIADLEAQLDEERSERHRLEGLLTAERTERARLEQRVRKLEQAIVARMADIALDLDDEPGGI